MSREFEPELERQAKNGQEMPDGLEYPDQIMYLSMSLLYARLKQGVVDRDTAIREKKKLRKEYQAYQQAEQMGREWVANIRDTETARAEYRKDRTLENADKLLAAIEGVKYGK